MPVKNEYLSRITAVINNMESSNFDCLMLSPSSNMFYLCGYNVRIDERLTLLIIAPGKEPLIFANKISEGQMIKTGIPDIVLWNDGENPYQLLSKALIERSISTSHVAVDSNMPARFILPLSQICQCPHFSLGDKLVEVLRIKKSAYELEKMASACSLADIALAKIFENGSRWIGKTEKDLQAELMYEETKLGLNPRPPLVCAGLNAAVPRHVSDTTIMERGMGVYIDFGATLDGYNTDITRNFFLGRPSELYLKVYSIVLEANRLGRAAAIPGNRFCDVDAAAREYISAQGFGKEFIHRTGHGIGIDGHEGPGPEFSPKMAIQPGMTFSVEPGIYIPGQFGIRIEDEVFVTETGSGTFHKTPKELLIFE